MAKKFEPKLREASWDISILLSTENPELLDEELSNVKSSLNVKTSFRLRSSVVTVEEKFVTVKVFGPMSVYTPSLIRKANPETVLNSDSYIPTGKSFDASIAITVLSLMLVLYDWWSIGLPLLKISSTSVADISSFNIFNDVIEPS